MYLDTPAEVFLRNQLSSKAVDPKEIQANTFAAELLMPEKLVRDEFSREQSAMSRGFSVVPVEELVERLASKFKVSVQAMTFRLANLELMRLA
jgi:Zn-dependent peptidase ImmA (M78 family)